MPDSLYLPTPGTPYLQHPLLSNLNLARHSQLDVQVISRGGSVAEIQNRVLRNTFAYRDWETDRKSVV